MLPSSGYFKGINCPFYDSGLCERPYCHFRHVKRDSLTTQSHGIESGAMLEKLVTSALQKVLQQTEALTGSAGAPIQCSTSPACDSSTAASSYSASKATYNPTPISELNKIKNTEAQAEETRKRHIPVPYTPRKPTNTLLKKPVDANDSTQIEPLTFIPPPLKFSQNCSDKQQLETYLPKESAVSTEVYSSNTENELQKFSSNQIEPLEKQHTSVETNINKKKLLEYSPTKVTKRPESSSIKYRPTPRSQVPCFSSDEEEPDAKKVKLSMDLNELDDLGPEFDILGQILDEEKLNQKFNPKPHPDKIMKSMNGHDSHIKLNKDAKIEKNTTLGNGDTLSKTDKTCTDKSTLCKEDKNNGTITMSTTTEPKEKSEARHDKKYHKKSQSGKTEKSLSESKDKSEARHDKKDHKRSHRDKSDNREKKSEAGKSSKTDNTKHSDRGNKTDISKSSHKDPKKETSKSSKHSRSSSEKDSKSHSKHKSNSKHDKISSKDRDHKDSKSSNTHKSSRSKNNEKDEINHYKESKEKRKEKSKEGKKIEIGQEEIDKVSICSGDIGADEVLVNEEMESESSESDEETRAMECKKIFEEYVPTVKVTPAVQETGNIIDDDNAEQYVPGKVRISRTIDKNIIMQPKCLVKPDYKVNAAQAMSERLAKVREYHASRSIQAPDSHNLSVKSDSPKGILSLSSKVRIAHVPYASTLVNAKKAIPPTTSMKKDLPSTSCTTVQTNKKGAQRTAHIPNEKFIDRPGVLEPLASKIPANIRSIYLNMMIDECLKIYIHPTDAYNRAQHEELNTSKKCSKVQIYKNSAVLTVTRLRKELQECNGIKKSASDCSTLQGIPQGASGNTTNAGSWSIESKNRATTDMSKEFRGAKFYKNITKWVLTEQQLQDNGFPMTHPSLEKGRAIIYGQNKNKPPKGFIRTCCRCKKEYTVDKRGFPAVKEECIYHPNNKYRYRGEAKYQCCSQDGMSDGCCVAPSHVFEYVDYENLKGFVTTMPPVREMDDYGVYSLDCEMCYTTHGLDLTRVTVIDSNCKVVYETLIRPIHPILDYNTRYSGITEEQMLDVKTTLLEVQATLLTMFNSKTILMGHSLESDFKVLKLIHSTVIDTSVLFPHKMGPPFKRALRNLSSEYLKKIIQNSVDGHDSAEDATVCMELVIYKLKEDLKTR